MPELPDVEVMRRHVARTVLKKTITDVTIHEPRVVDDSVRNLRGASFTTTGRHGKYLLLETDGATLVMHFGMTGSVETTDDAEDAAVAFSFDERALGYRTQRKFGKVFVISGTDTLIEDKGLGPDALDIDEGAYSELLQAKRGMVKTALMDQSTAAGVGNIYADEALFHAGIHPETDLSEVDTEELARTVQRVLETAIDVRVEDFPRSWLITARREGADCPRCAGTIRNATVGGRTTYFCDSHQ